MKIAVIGAEGIIGRVLVEYLCQQGYSVRGYDLFPKSINTYDHINYEYICINEENICYNGVDGIVLLAAKRPITAFSLDDYYQNVKIVYENVLKAVSDNVRRIVFASSISVYSEYSLPYREIDYSIPLNLYGASKLAGEQIGNLLTQKTNSSFIALRFAHVIGVNEKKGFLIRTVLDNALNKRKQIVYGDGAQRRHYVYVKDVCRAIEAALLAKNHSGVFNIGMKNIYSNLELAEYANKVFHNNGNILHDFSKPMIGKDDEMSIDKARLELDFVPKYDLEESFLDLAESKK